MARAAATLVVMAGLTGCYSYRAIERPARGTAVRIHVPVRAAVETMDRGETISFEGTVLQFGDSLLLETKSARVGGQFSPETFALDTLRVDPTTLAGIEERVYSRGKTYAFTGLVTAGAAGLVVAAVNAAGGGDDNGGSGNGVVLPATIVKPVVSALFRLFGR